MPVVLRPPGLPAGLMMVGLVRGERTMHGVHTAGNVPLRTMHVK